MRKSNKILIISLVISIVSILFLLACSSLQGEETKKQDEEISPSEHLKNVKSSLPRLSKKQISATITMKDKKTFEVTEIKLYEIYHPGLPFYEHYNDYKVEYVPIRDGPIIFNVPYEKVEHITYRVIKEKTGPTSRFEKTKASVILNDGRHFEGDRYLLSEPSLANRRAVESVTGRLLIEGYPAEFNIPISKVDTITFLHDKTRNVVAELKKTDGTFKKNISSIKFKINGGDSRSSAMETNIIKFKVGDSTLEIPVKDVASLEREQKGEKFSIVLRSGKRVKGTPRFGIYGKTVVFNEKVKFDNYIKEHNDDIQSIVFK